MPKQPYASFDLTQSSQETLLQRFPPKYAHASLNHITIRYGTDDGANLFEPETIEVIGYTDDNQGIEALLVRIDGETFREDGNPWHITISFDKDAHAPKELDPFQDQPLEGKYDKRKERPYAAVMSNKLIRNALSPDIEGYSVEYLDTPIIISATPKIFTPDAETETIPDIEP